MNIETLHISDELMNALVHQLFDTMVINRQRQTMRILAEIDKENHYPNANISDLVVINNTKLPITQEMANKFIQEWNKSLNVNSRERYPYFTLTSDNSVNGLRVFISQWDEKEGVTCNDIKPFTNYYLRDNDKIIFSN